MTDIIERTSKRKILSVSDLKFFRYFYHKISNQGVITLLKGPRGVGKTTSILQFLYQNQLSGKDVLYISADDTNLANTSIFELVENFHERGGDIIAIDEIHKRESWARDVKSIFDSFDNLQIIISGSSSIEITRKEIDLGRRAIPLDVRGLSFREYLILKYQLELPTFTISKICSSHKDIISEILVTTKKSKVDILKEFKSYLIIR